LKKAILSILMLMVLSSEAFAAGGHGSVVVDIVGSNAEDTRITAPAAGSIDLEIIGSNARNTEISTKERVCTSCCCWPYSCPAAPCNYSQSYTATVPSVQHLGVDAWYGTFWYTPFDHLPKWPQA
jgi:hypothetical protein